MIYHYDAQSSTLVHERQEHDRKPATCNSKRLLYFNVWKKVMNQIFVDSKIKQDCDDDGSCFHPCLDRPCQPLVGAGSVAAAGIRGQLVRLQQDEQTSGLSQTITRRPRCNLWRHKGFVSGQSLKSDLQTSREQGSQSMGQFSFTTNTWTIRETGAGTMGLVAVSTTAHASALATHRCSFNGSW
jgi:hypothetical protein